MLESTDYGWAWDGVPVVSSDYVAAVDQHVLWLRDGRTVAVPASAMAGASSAATLVVHGLKLIRPEAVVAVAPDTRAIVQSMARPAYAAPSVRAGVIRAQGFGGWRRMTTVTPAAT